MEARLQKKKELKGNSKLRIKELEAKLALSEAREAAHPKGQIQRQHHHLRSQRRQRGRFNGIIIIIFGVEGGNGGDTSSSSSSSESMAATKIAQNEARKAARKDVPGQACAQDVQAHTGTSSSSSSSLSLSEEPRMEEQEITSDIVYGKLAEEINASAEAKRLEEALEAVDEANTLN